MAGKIDWSRIKPLNGSAEAALNAWFGIPRKRATMIHLMRYAEYYLT